MRKPMKTIHFADSHGGFRLRSEEGIGKATNGGARAAHDAGLARLKHWLLRISGRDLGMENSW